MSFEGTQTLGLLQKDCMRRGRELEVKLSLRRWYDSVSKNTCMDLARPEQWSSFYDLISCEPLGKSLNFSETQLSHLWYGNNNRTKLIWLLWIINEDNYVMHVKYLSKCHEHSRYLILLGCFILILCLSRNFSLLVQFYVSTVLPWHFICLFLENCPEKW